MKISFIGYGNIAKSITEGLRHNSDYELHASAPSLNRDLDSALRLTPIIIKPFLMQMLLFSPLKLLRCPRF